jgi:hypothetical protein
MKRNFTKNAGLPPAACPAIRFLTRSNKKAGSAGLWWFGVGDGLCAGYPRQHPANLDGYRQNP